MSAGEENGCLRADGAPGSPAKGPSDADREIETLILVCKALWPLTHIERRRVLKYLWARLVEAREPEQVAEASVSPAREAGRTNPLK